MYSLSFVLFFGPCKLKETERTESSPYLFYLYSVQMYIIVLFIQKHNVLFLLWV